MMAQNHDNNVFEVDKFEVVFEVKAYFIFYFYFLKLL